MMPSRSARRTAVLLAALSFTGGCATKGDLRNLQLEVRQLTARQDSLLQELRQQNLATQDTLRTTSSQLFDIRGQVVQLLRQIQEEQARSRELLRENQRSIAALRDQMESSRRMPPVSGIEPGLAGGGLAGGVGVTPGAGPAGDPVSLYNAAIEQYQRQAYTAARAGFELFLESYSGNADLAPWAIFYLAETLVQQDERDRAIELYQEVGQRFPASDAVPQALYRLGLTYIEQDRVSEARDVLERVANTWPDSDAGALARARLQELGGVDG
jgi:tol-pal system protein YbgF